MSLGPFAVAIHSFECEEITNSNTCVEITKSGAAVQKSAPLLSFPCSQCARRCQKLLVKAMDSCVTDDPKPQTKMQLGIISSF